MKKAKYVALAVSLLLVTGILAGCGDKKTEEGGQAVLKIGTDPTYPPFESTDDKNELIGFDIDLAKAIGEKLDMKVEFVSNAFDGIFTGMNSGAYDIVMAAVSMTPKRLETMLFSKPYLANGQVILNRKGDAVLNSLEELEGLNVGVQLGTTADTATDKYADEVGFEVTKYDEIIQTFSAMKAGHVDAIAVDYAVAIEYVGKEPDSYQISPVMLTNEPIAVAIKKDNTELQEKINTALLELQEEGKLKEISEKWMGGDYTSNIDEELNVVE